MTEPAADYTPAEQTLHVLPAAEGGWMVKRGGEPLPLESFKHKREALAYARKLGEALVVHDRAALLPKMEAGGKIIRFGQASGRKGRPTSGSAAGLIKMAEDFDAPLDDFADYM